MRVQFRRKESSLSLSHLLMSFLFSVALLVRLELTTETISLLLPFTCTLVVIIYDSSEHRAAAWRDTCLSLTQCAPGAIDAWQSMSALHVVLPASRDQYALSVTAAMQLCPMRYAIQHSSKPVKAAVSVDRCAYSACKITRSSATPKSTARPSCLLGVLL